MHEGGVDTIEHLAIDLDSYRIANLFIRCVYRESLTRMDHIPNFCGFDIFADWPKNAKFSTRKHYYMHYEH